MHDHDDDAMDRLLEEALGTGVPHLSPDFETRLERRLRPRRLTPRGRVLISLYAVAAAATAAWALRDLPPQTVLVALAAGAPIAAAASAYGRRLAFGH